MLLPANTDFYGLVDNPYRGAAVPQPNEAATRYLPRAQRRRRLGRRHLSRRVGDAVCSVQVEIAADTAGANSARLAAQHLADAWKRWDIRCELAASTDRTFSALQHSAPRETTTPAPTASDARIAPLRRIRFLLARPGDAVEGALAARGLTLPAHGESYAIAPSGEDLCVISRSHAGFERGAATVAQSLVTEDTGLVSIDADEIVDWPDIDIRFLGGWALWRTDSLRLGIDLAWAFKANRVLYNGWGWIPGDRLWKEDEYFVEYARERGVELVYELRRMSFGRDYDLKSPAARKAILNAFEDAAACGFRSFGLLFDDVPWETAEDECALAGEIYARLQEVTGSRVEFFCCPQFYWYPGQMNAKWSGRADAEETAEQRRYLETYGRDLPADIEVYLANFWGGHPGVYQQDLKSEFTDLVGRKPIFFDNEQINDYRHGALWPFPLTARPSDFGKEVRGYYLNSARPLDAYAAAAATAMAYAWNTHDYVPEQAMAAALRWYYSPELPAAQAVARGLSGLSELANAWAGSVHTAVNHYKTIWHQIDAGAVDATQLAEWKRSLKEVRREFITALEMRQCGVRPEAQRGLEMLVRSTHRMEGDLELFEGYLAALSDPETVDAFVVASARMARTALDHVASLLPPAPNIEPLLQGFDAPANTQDASHADAEIALDPLQSQGWSWIRYFYINTRRSLRTVRSAMLQRLGR